MATQSDWKQELRKSVTAALGDGNHPFSFTAFIEEFGVERDTADVFAEALYSKTYVQCLADQVITSHEDRRLRQLSELLEISEKRSTELATLAGKEAYRAHHVSAMLDGTISEAERAQLQQLQVTIASLAEGADELPQGGDAGERKAKVKTAGREKSSKSKVTRGELVNQALSLGITQVKSKNMAVLQREIDSVQGETRGMVGFDEAGFLKSLVYKAKSSPETVIAQLSMLRSMDKKIEGKRDIIGSVRILGGVLAILGVLVGFLFVANDSGPSSMLIALCVCLVVVGIIIFVGASIFLMQQSLQDVPDRRYEAAIGILKLISKDLARDSLIDVKVDCRPHNHNSKKVRTGKVGYWNVKFHVDTWLVLQGAFADGTKFSLKLIEKHQDRWRKKRSQSGKIKHKSKTKTASEAILRLKIKQKKNPDLCDGWQRRASKKHDVVRLPEWTESKALNVQGDRLTLRSTTKSSWDAVNPANRGASRAKRDGVKWMAMMFMSLYGVLDSARTNSEEPKQ